MIHTLTLNRSRLLASAIAGILATGTANAQELTLSPLVVTTSKMDTPYQLTSDPRKPRIALPAQDGGAYLKSIPGFSVSRKGGTGGEPELRGLGGSRLSILSNGGYIPGGCSGRMDPPTSYTFPQSYDRIEITKGPQSVRYGPAPAGSVRFERDAPEFTEDTTTGFASYTAGSNERNDLATDITTGNETGFARFIGTLSSQDDYEDGDGERVHSAFQRWSTTLITGWTPGEDSLVEFTYDRSDAENAYDDRRMDGTDFDRTGYRLRARQQNLTDWLEEVEIMAFYNDIDHVMDNFRLRDPAEGAMPMTRRVQRTTTGGRLSADLNLSAAKQMHAGMDYSENEHGDSGGLMGDSGLRWRDADVPVSAEFVDVGVFAELEHNLDDHRWITLGARGDYHEVEAKSGDFSTVNAGATDHSAQWSAFGRYEQALMSVPITLYTGLGRSERAPDFWERGTNFDLDSESLTQVDAGLSLDGQRTSGTLSLFYGWYDDYILITEAGDEARNLDAEIMGAEADLAVVLTPTLTFNASAAYTRGRNDSDGGPLAQMPPLEGTVGLDYERGIYSAGAQWRGVSGQHRIDEGSGTIYSIDTGKTPGFATASAYAGVELFADTQFSVGVDNLFDRRYAEHIQQGSADLGVSDERINEPGRTYWANITTAF